MSGATLLRLELFGAGLKVGWRPLINLEHGTLCRQFGLDPNRYWFDLPSSARGVGSAVSGAGGGRGARDISGYVMQAGVDEPVGKIYFARESERFSEHDPRDKREFLKL